MPSRAHRILNRLARLITLYSASKNVDIKSAVIDLFPDEEITVDILMVKLKELKVRKTESSVEINVLTSTRQGNDISRNQLVQVVEVYIKNHYLKSFGYKKLKIDVDRPQKVPVEISPIMLGTS